MPLNDRYWVGGTFMNPIKQLPKLYRQLAEWWPLLSAPADYAEEAAFYRRAATSACLFPPKTLLELGSGGGNNASHLKRHFQLTLVDLSPEMVAVSQALNPECEHIVGDMRTLRLDRQFDIVFIHDAIAYLTTARDLRHTIATAHEHCRPGGVALLAPDHTLETFRPSTRHGGRDAGDRSLRYLEWTWDPDPDDTRYTSIMVYLLREGGNQVRCIEDRHQFGLFSTDFWLKAIAEFGFQAKTITHEHSEPDSGSSFLFLGLKPPDRP